MKTKSIKYLIVTALALIVPGMVSAATLSVSPASQTVKSGETFTVTVQLDTQGASIDGIDLRYLNFNPSMLQVQDADSSTPGVQIKVENLMDITAVNSVDNNTGKILFSRLVKGGTKYKGSGTLATITFKAVGGGTANLTFNYTPKSTTDSNVSGGGEDLLSAVINGSYRVTGAAAVPRTPAVDSQGNPLPEDFGGQLPDGDDSPFQFSERRSFFQVIIDLITEAINRFKFRLSEIF